MINNQGLIYHWSFDEASGKEALDHVTGIRDKIEYVLNEARYNDSHEGDMLGIRVELEAGKCTQMGMKFRCSPGSEEETLLCYDRKESVLTVDRNKSSLDELADWDRGFKAEGWS